MKLYISIIAILLSFVFGISTVNADITSNLEAYWTLDSINTNWVASTTSDVTGNGHTGSLVNFYSSTSTVTGQIDEAIDFDGVNDYISVSSLSGLPTTASSTVSLWVKIGTSPSGTDVLLSYFTTTYGYYKLILDSGNVPILYNTCSNGGGGICISDSNTTLLSNTWYHVVGTFGGLNEYDSGIIYVNGVSQGTGTFSSFHSNPAGIIFRIGSEVNNTNYCDCIIDDVRLYSRILTPTEINELYNYSSTATTTMETATTTLAFTHDEWLFVIMILIVLLSIPLWRFIFSGWIK